mgnify:FL=1
MGTIKNVLHRFFMFGLIYGMLSYDAWVNTNLKKAMYYCALDLGGKGEEEPRGTVPRS